MTEHRKTVLKELWDMQDEAYDLMYEYDSLPHRYGKNTLYQAEAYIINLIGQYPDITSSELATRLRKTPSACSQIIRKLREKGWVEQIRNQDNNRQFNLRLTESGEEVYRDHVAFNQDSQVLTFRLLEDFTDEELSCHIKVQRKLNEAYQADVLRCREQFQC